MTFLTWKTFIAVVFVAWLASNFLLQSPSLTKEDLCGKRVIVTGASQNIGEEIAYEYCRNGANVFITARREERLKQVQAKCLELGAQSCGYFPLDMGNMEEIESFISSAHQFLGGIDFIVLNHIMRTSTLEWKGNEENLEYLDQSVKVNYLSYIHLSTAAHKHLTTSGGGLIVVSSLAGMIRTLNMATYGASKAALNRFYDNLRYEMLARGESEDFSITLCMLGLIDTKSDYSSQRNMKIKAHPINETAKSIIQGGVLKMRNVFIPQYTKLFYIIQTLFPYQFLDRILLKFVYDV